MNLSEARKIADAVLYEGYILYPYRASSIKNRQRWTFGGIYPPAYVDANPGADRADIQAECLLRGGGATQVEVALRFLQLQERSVGALEEPWSGAGASGAPKFHEVPSCSVGGRGYGPWQESVEREVRLDALPLAALAEQPARQRFELPAATSFEALGEADGGIQAVLVRRRRAIAGELEVSARRLDSDLFKLRFRVSNSVPLRDASACSRDEALLVSLVSAHIIAVLRGGDFLSSIDPPEECRGAAGACTNQGVYPVLVGPTGGTDMILCSPIILYDYPEIAPESAGDLFDGTEIDEILTLRILTMTDDEKREARETDDRARQLLDRSEELTPGQFARLHGALRQIHPSGEALGEAI